MKADDGTSSWAELFRGRLAVQTILLNLGILLYAIDIFLISTLMPSIVADIGGVAFYAWATMLFVVGAIVGSAGYGPLRARVGGRKAYAMAGVVFLIGALVCSLAPTMGVLLGGRLVQGLGAGCIIAGSMSFISTLFEARLRTRVVATTSATWILASIVGPLQGGVFAEIGWWRGAFWLYVPVVIVFIAGVWWKLPAAADRTTTDSRALRFPLWRLMLLGLGVLCVGATGLVASEIVRVAFFAVAILIVWYAFYRDANANNHLFPSRPLSLSAPVGLGFWSHMLVAGAYTAVAIYLPLVLRIVHDVTPLYVGFMNAALSMGWSISSAVVAGLHGGREHGVIVAGPLLMLVGCAGLGGVTTTGGHLGLVAGCAFVIGIGIGMFHVHMTAKVMSVALDGEESITASSLTTIRSLGMAFGAAFAGAVANFAGLESEATRETVSASVTWVYMVNLIPMALAAVVVTRFIRFERRPPPIDLNQGPS